MFVSFLFDFLFILFRIAWWPSAGKVLSACAVLFVLSIWCLGQDVEFNCITFLSIFSSLTVQKSKVDLHCSHHICCLTGKAVAINTYVSFRILLF